MGQLCRQILSKNFIAQKSLTFEFGKHFFHQIFGKPFIEELAFQIPVALRRCRQKTHGNNLGLLFLRFHR